MDFMSFLKEILRGLDRSARIYIVVHEHPDGDAVGSQTALTLYLRKLGWQAFALQTEPLSASYDYFVRDVPTQHPEDISTEANNVFIALDCNTTERIAEAVRFQKYLAVIDHHPEMDSWGKYRYTLVTASSTCEILMDLLTRDGYKFDHRQINDSIYLGLLTDSGNFSHSNISKHTFECAEGLVAAGVQPYLIIQRVFNNKTPAQLKLQSVFLNNVQVFSNGAIAISTLSPQDYATTHTCHNDTEGFVNQLLTLKNAKIAAFIEYGAEKVSCSLRSSDPNIAVNQVALKHGGGGHTCAAACKIEPQYFNLKEFINELDSLLNP